MGRLVELITSAYPTETDAFTIARNLEEDLRELLTQGGKFLQVENSIVFLGRKEEINIRILTRSGTDEVFPNLLFRSYGLGDLNDSATEALFFIILDTIQYYSQGNITFRIEESWDSKTYVIHTEGGATTLSRSLDKDRVGIFLYMLHLRERFAKNPDVCIVISDLEPLIKKQKEMEKNIATLDRASFLKQYTTVSEADYDQLLKGYETESTASFRYLLLLWILTDFGPFLQVMRNHPYDRITVKNSRAFQTLMDRCASTGARYTITYLILTDYDEGHANIVIVDRKLKTIERYEPNGFLDSKVSFSRRETGTMVDLFEKADDELYSLAKQKGYTYEPPLYFCPKIGAQQIEIDFGGSDGYCVTWSLLYAIERIESGLSNKEIAANFIDILAKRYALSSSGKESVPKQIETLLKTKVYAIFGSMDDIYVKLSASLGVKVRYEQGKLVYFD
jgi:hypothetical protein